MFDFNTETGLIRMYGIIGEWDDEISAVDFMRALDEMDGRDVVIQLKSAGGEIDDGLSIYNQIEAYEGNVKVEIDTQAASIASVFPMAADEIVIRKRSEIFIHDPWTVAIGNAREFRGIADYLDALAMEIAGVYEDRTGREAQEWFDMMQETKRFSAEEAVEYGLADCVLGKCKPKKLDTREPVQARLKAVAMANSLDKRLRISKYQT